MESGRKACPWLLDWARQCGGASLGLFAGEKLVRALQPTDHSRFASRRIVGIGPARKSFPSIQQAKYSIKRAILDIVYWEFAVKSP